MQKENENRTLPSNADMSPNRFVRKTAAGVAVLFFAFLTMPVLLNCSARQSPTEPPNTGRTEATDGPRQTKPGERSAGPLTGIDRAIEVVQSRSGVYLYTYAETIEPIEPRKDYLEKYRVYDQTIVANLRKLIAENREYSPDFKARCLPVWDYGLEFREEKEAVLFLFSFRCNTIRYVEGNLFKDFTPQRTEFFKIFRYEIKPETASLIEKK